MIRLSIIIPHYKSVEYLAILLNSIPSDDEIEVLVIDDKSPNVVDCEELCIKYPNVRIIHNENILSGAGVCRNIGLSYALGEWVVFADADDYFVKGFYTHIKKYFESEFDAVFFVPTSVDLDTSKTSSRHMNYQRIIENYNSVQSRKNELFLRYHIPVPWSKMVRREFIEKRQIRFEEIIASNDVMFSVKVGHLMEKFDVSTDVIYCVTRSSHNLTMNKNENIFDARVDAFIRFYKFLKDNLTEEEFNILGYNGRDLLIKAFEYGLGIRKVIDTYMKFRKNGIVVFDIKLLNPIFVVNKSIQHYKRYEEVKKHLKS
jgi:glycosyltransferase involved in cell wall biosynthesis